MSDLDVARVAPDDPETPSRTKRPSRARPVVPDHQISAEWFLALVTLAAKSLLEWRHGEGLATARRH